MTKDAQSFEVAVAGLVLAGVVLLFVGETTTWAIAGVLWLGWFMARYLVVLDGERQRRRRSR